MKEAEVKLGKEAVKEFNRLSEAAHKSLSGFYFSRPIVTYQYGAEDKIEIGLADFLVLSAIANLNVLIDGETGKGKTEMARAFIRGVFASNAYLQLSLESDLSKIIDVDVKGLVRGKKTLSESQIPSEVVLAPAVVVDELNRIPSKVGNIFQQYLSNGSLNLVGGATIRPGVKLDDKETYQFKIGLRNVGDSYSGTYELDEAVIDRFPVKVDFDSIEPTIKDKQNMAEGSKRFGASDVEAQDLTKEVISLYKFVKEIPIGDKAVQFIIMLSNLDHCYRSPVGLKSGLVHFDKQICKGCKAALAFDNICGSTRAISSRSLISLRDFSRAFAFYRHVMLPDSPIEVEIEDSKAAAEFVLEPSAIIQDFDWVSDHGGNSYPEALKILLGDLEEALNKSLSDDSSEKLSTDWDTKKRHAEIYPYAPFVDVDDLKRLYRELKAEKNV